MFTEKTWLDSSLKAVNLVLGELGIENVVHTRSGEFSAHPVWDFLHKDEFDPSSFDPSLRLKLDSLGWQLVITGSRFRWRDAEYPGFAIAPMLQVDELPEAVYHVTQKNRFDSILTQGLCPSSPARRHSLFPDTEAKIHASLRLETADGQGDGAAFWMREFPRKLGGSVSDYGIIRIDAQELPQGTRAYRDTHSHWGVVFDSLDRIARDKLRPLTDKEVDELLERCGPHVFHEN